MTQPSMSHPPLPSELCLNMSDIHLVAEVGRGSSAAVWKGVWRGTEVAVKQFFKTQQQQQQAPHLQQPLQPRQQQPPLQPPPLQPLLPQHLQPRQPLQQLHLPQQAPQHLQAIQSPPTPYQQPDGGYQQIQELLHECCVMTRLRHPKVVLLMGCSTEPLCLVTEYCRGHSLFDVLHGNARQGSEVAHSVPVHTHDAATAVTTSLSWNQRIKIAVDIAQGCTYLHNSQPQIIHRDLKSSNILLVEPVRSAHDIPNAKISDFGLSRFTRQWEAPLTGWAGTMCWMAPEILNRRSYDEKVDVYSFGVVLYELLTSSVPYRELTCTPQQLGQHIAEGLRPDMSKIPQDCPEKLRSLMSRCLSGTPKCRPSFDEALHELRCVHISVTERCSCTC
eukprot:GHVS01090831.1.p1 GENE.GHVS01090831.1~~GHVS01090831.1.p1  ORF type:complete len:389 (+),score=55.50 GHVS01090831.1:267-1433(+)